MPPSFVLNVRSVPDPSYWAVGRPTAINASSDLCGFVASRTPFSYTRPALWLNGEAPEVVSLPLKGGDPGPDPNPWYGLAGFSDMNDARVCVGHYLNPEGQDAIIYENGNLTWLNEKLDDSTSAAAASINGDNLIAGTVGGVGAKQVFLYEYPSAAQPLLIGPLPGHDSAGYPHVDEDGAVVFLSQKFWGPKENRVVIRTPDGAIEDLGPAPEGILPALADFSGGHICGWVSQGDPGSFNGFVHHSGSYELFHHPDDAFDTFSLGVDAAGVSAGTAMSIESYFDRTGEFHQDEDHRGWIRFPQGHEHEGFHDLTSPSYSIDGLGELRIASVKAINASGQMAAYVSATPDPWDAYWDPAKQQVSSPAVLRLETVADKLKRKQQDLLLVLVQMFGGADVGGDGWGVTGGGKIIKIPPRDPLISSVAHLHESHRDLLIADAVERIAELFSRDATRDSVRRVAYQIKQEIARQSRGGR